MRAPGSWVATRAPAGFTLLEVLMVLAIIGLVAAFTLPALRRPPDKLRLEAATHTLVSALRFSRVQAIARNEDVIVTLHAERRILESSTGPALQLDQEISVEMIFAASERRRNGAGAIRFYPDGTSSGADIVLTLNKRRTRVSVNWLTGEARLDPAGNGPS
jgi:general secretion pathway protein H